MDFVEENDPFANSFLHLVDPFPQKQKSLVPRNKKTMRSITLALCLLLYCSTLQAQVDTIYSFPHKVLKASIREGMAQYLVFFKMKDKPRQAKTFVWNRSTSYQQKNGKQVLEVVQHWYGGDSTDYRYVYTLVNPENYLPIYHKTNSQRTGIEAFDFYENQIKGSDSVANNKKASFDLQGHTPLNWELDLETFSLLDLKEGKSFFINFYHPGGRSGPKLYEYKVVGSEKLRMVDGKHVDCWKLRIDYSPKSYAVFYISKKDKEVLKMEEDFGIGIRYKIRLAVEM